MRSRRRKTQTFTNVVAFDTDLLSQLETAGVHGIAMDDKESQDVTQKEKVRAIEQKIRNAYRSLPAPTRYQQLTSTVAIPVFQNPVVSAHHEKMRKQICKSRFQKRAMMFVTGMAGRGSANKLFKKPKRSWKSKVKC